MKIKVIKAFVDKDTLDYCEIGKTLDISPERAKELRDSGYVEDAAETSAGSKKSGKSE